MTKIEYMAMSLPYGLKVLRGDNITILKVSGIDIDCNSVLFTEKNTTTYGNISHSKPILRPLSELTTEIHHKGGKFIPITVLKEMNDGDDIYLSEFGVSIDNGYAAGYNLGVAFTFIQKLVEWHFDICGLIESGEAVNYRTLPDFVF